jgi:RNA polymerase sigma factor (sigma-70 family)
MEGFAPSQTQCKVVISSKPSQEAVTSGNAENQLELRLARARWVQLHVFPHDRQMRNWFQKRAIAHDDIEEAMQEAYYRISKLDAVDQIANPGAYFFSIARNFVAQRLKQRSVVPLDTLAEMDAADFSMAARIEDTVATRLIFEKIRKIIDTLPVRCQKIVELRKIDNWSQKEIAQHLGITEKAVEKQIWLGVRAIREAWQSAERVSETRLEALENQNGYKG